MKGEKDINENTKVVQCWDLHPAQGLKTKVYLHKDGWSKPGQSTPSEQHKKNKETEQENSMNITESWKMGLWGPKNRVYWEANICVLKKRKDIGHFVDRYDWQTI